MLNEERLSYMGSVVLGLNDALVELTGALAGFTLSIQNSRTIALVGLITGISASLSMAASEYLSSRTEADGDVNPKKAAIYTGIAYVFTVISLILPFFLISNYILSLMVTLTIAILIIAFFNYYISVANDQPFFARFGEMTLISLGVAAVSFGIGFLVNRFFGLDI
ncbi:MAG: VIT1/CCC1 transporter family protein, partial [Eubacteriales bacterium]